MRFLRGFAKFLAGIFKYILAMVLILVLLFAFIALISVVQSAIFVPKDFVIWVVHNSVMVLALVFEVIFAIFAYYLLNRKKTYFSGTEAGRIAGFIRMNRFISLLTLSVILLTMMYYMIVNVSVIYDRKIANHTFFVPQGKVYLYSQILDINTGVYGKRGILINSKGDFYYIIELQDGTKINLMNDGGVKNNNDIYQTIADLDREFVKAGIPKKVDMRYFYLCQEKLDKVYSNRIKGVLDNVK